MAEKVNDDYINFEPKLSLDDPAGDYADLMNEMVRSGNVPTDIQFKCFEKISGAARKTIWKMLFDEPVLQRIKQLQKASALLKLLKQDACLYESKEYNKWIVLVRDELFKRNMLHFWKNEIVENKLGPCRARDSVVFEEMGDHEIEDFYKYDAGEVNMLKAALKKMSLETPLRDYKLNKSAVDRTYDDVIATYRQINEEAGDVIWKYLFDEPVLTAGNSKKAADFLQVYKTNACFFESYKFNAWVTKLKRELIKRNYIDFWNDVIVKKQLGWSPANAEEQKKALQFYELNEESIEEYIMLDL